MTAARIFGRNFAFHKKANGIWEPVKEWSMIYQERTGEWYAPHIFEEGLNKDGICIKKLRENKDPRLMLINKYGTQGSVVAKTLHNLYNIPATLPCNLSSVLEIGYNIGIYEGRYGHVSTMYEPNLYTNLFEKNHLGNLYKYVRPLGLEVSLYQYEDLIDNIYHTLKTS